MTFGEKLKICRKAFDITQETLAEKLNTSKQVISRYENGARDPKITIVQQYATALNVPVAVLIDPNIFLCVWDHISYVDNYFTASDKDRLMLVQKMGLDPRVAEDYSQIQGSKIFTKPTMTAENYHLIELYHLAHPSDQQAVCTILEKYDQSLPKVNTSASQEIGDQKIS